MLRRLWSLSAKACRLYTVREADAREAKARKTVMRDKCVRIRFGINMK